MLLKDKISAGEIHIPTGNNFYNSRPWFLLIKNDLLRMLKYWHGNREMFDDMTDSDITDLLDLSFMANCWKYDHLYELYIAEYNPIWNYEGSETRDRTLTSNDSHTGQDTSTLSGHDDTVQTGSIKDQNGGALTRSRTTYDSSTELETDKEADTRETTTTYNSKKDEVTYGKTDTMTYASGHSIGETEHEVMTRGGNMGTTSTQSMMLQEMDVAIKMRLLDTIALDCVQTICYI